MEHLHRHNLVHRDIKPSNIIFVNGVPKLADIGLVADTTEARSFVGTMGFIPPEGPGAPQADLYSLGKVLYEMSTGRDRRDFPQLPSDLREFSDPNALIEINEIILHACEEDPKVRYRSAEAIYQHLLRVQGGKSIRRILWLGRHLTLAKRVAAVAIVPVMLAGVIIWQARHGGVRSPERGSQEILIELTKGLESARGDPEGENAYRQRLASVLPRIIKPSDLSFTLGDAVHLCFSPTGADVLVFGQDRTVEVYDGELGRHRFPLKHNDPVLSAAFSADGSTIFTVTRDGQGHLWQVTSGWPASLPQFGYEFDNPQEPWEGLVPSSTISTQSSHTYSNGTLRIQSEPGAADTWYREALVPPKSDTVFSDLVLSLDILDWDTNLPNLTVGLIARASERRWGARNYAGQITFGDSDLGGRARFEIARGRHLKKVSFVADPRRAYRLIFSVVGSDLHLNLFELNNLGEAVKTLSLTDKVNVEPGFIGILVNTQSSYGKNPGLGAYDVTVDNFVVTGITNSIPWSSESVADE